MSKLKCAIPAHPHMVLRGCKTSAESDLSGSQRRWSPRSAHDVLAQGRSSPASASSVRPCPSRCPPAPAPYSRTHQLCCSTVPSDGSRETALEATPTGLRRVRGDIERRRGSCWPARAGGASAGRSRPVASVTPESARRFDAVERGKIKRTYLLQLVCGRRLSETVGEVVEPCLIFILEVKQSAYRILPALRPGAAVPRWSVVHLRLRSLVALPIAPLSLSVGQSHGH